MTTGSDNPSPEQPKANRSAADVDYALDLSTKRMKLEYTERSHSSSAKHSSKNNHNSIRRDKSSSKRPGQKSEPKSDPNVDVYAKSPAMHDNNNSPYGCFPIVGPGQDIRSWGVNEVCYFLTQLEGCGVYASVCIF